MTTIKLSSGNTIEIHGTPGGRGLIVKQGGGHMTAAERLELAEIRARQADAENR